MDISSILLVVHLVIALCMVGIILLQPSEGGGTGLGSDSGNTAMSAVRGKGTFLTKTTWALAAAFVIIALALAWLSRAPSSGGPSNALNSVVETQQQPSAQDVFAGITPESSGGGATATGSTDAGTTAGTTSSESQ